MSKRVAILALVTLSWALAGCEPTKSKVVAVTPGSGAVVGITTNTVSAQFDRAMNVGTIDSGSFHVVGSLSGVHTGTITYDTATETATFLIDGAFEDGDTVTVTLESSIRSLSRKKLRPYISTFTVDNIPPPNTDPFVLEGMTPGIESRTASRLSAIQLHYSSPFNPFSVGTESIQVIGERSGQRALTFDNIFGGTGDLPMTVDRAFLPGERVHVAVQLLQSIQFVDGEDAFLSFTVSNEPADWPTGALTQGAGGTDTQFLFLDVDQDGRDEWVVIDPSGSAQVQGNTAGVLDTPLAITLPGAVAASAFGDFNGDGLMDVVFLAQGGDRLYLLSGDATNTFSAPETILLDGFVASDFVAQHFDNDAFPDLFLTATDSLGGSQILWGAELPFAEGTALSNLQAIAPAVAADFDGDDLVDVACVVTGGNVEILTGDTRRGFTPLTTLTPSSPASRVTRANLDDNDLADVVCWAATGSGGSVYLALGDGTFTETLLPTATSADSSLIADWTGDGIFDILTPVPGVAAVDMYPGFGDGTFDPSVRFTTDDEVAHLRLGDVDGDGALDVGMVLQSQGWQVGMGSPTTPTLDNVVRTLDTTAAPGDTGVVFRVDADHADAIDGFTLVLSFDPTVIQVDFIETAGTDVGAIGVEFEIPQVDNTSGFVILGAIFDFLPPYDAQSLSPGTNQSIATGTFFVDVDAPSGTTTDFGPANGLGSPPADNGFVVAGLTVTPRLEVGVVSIEGSAPPPPPTGVNFLRGDVNNDGVVNVSDGTYLTSYLFDSGAAPPCLDAADLNDDGLVDLPDSTYLYNFLFGAGPDPVSPYPAVGPDPTDTDGLDCAL